MPKRLTQAKVDRAIKALNDLRDSDDYVEMVGPTGVAELRRARETLVELKRVEGWE